MTSWKAAPVACLVQGASWASCRSPSRWPPRCRPRDRLSLVGRLRRRATARAPLCHCRRSGRPLGSGRALSDAQAEHLQQLVRTHQPEELGIAALLWTSAVPSSDGPDPQGIRSRSGGADRRGRYLRRWGFTAKRPRQSHARDQDPEEVRQWLEETYPAIEARGPTEKGRKSIGGDEVGVAANSTACARLMRRGGSRDPGCAGPGTSERTKSRRSRTTARFGS